MASCYATRFWLSMLSTRCGHGFDTFTGRAQSWIRRGRVRLRGYFRPGENRRIVIRGDLAFGFVEYTPRRPISTRRPAVVLSTWTVRAARFASSGWQSPQAAISLFLEAYDPWHAQSIAIFSRVGIGAFARRGYRDMSSTRLSL